MEGTHAVNAPLLNQLLRDAGPLNDRNLEAKAASALVEHDAIVARTALEPVTAKCLPCPPARVAWRFVIFRDEENMISEVIATPIEPETAA